MYLEGQILQPPRCSKDGRVSWELWSSVSTSGNNLCHWQKVLDLHWWRIGLQLHSSTVLTRLQIGLRAFHYTFSDLSSFHYTPFNWRNAATSGLEASSQECNHGEEGKGPFWRGIFFSDVVSAELLSCAALSGFRCFSGRLFTLVGTWLITQFKSLSPIEMNSC